MCCFSGHVEVVSNTNIFARITPRGTQVLVYSMTLGASADLAMVLPIPVPARSAEDAVRFVNLEGYPSFFADMRRGFPEPVARGIPSFGRLESGPAPQPLVVHDVGAFEASFVPTTADFARLDPRFALPPQTWDQLPVYGDWGFAVFKLKGFAGGRSTKTIHPMAFEMRTRHPASLFFPTVHIHDGRVHRTARFDHALYAQVPEHTFGLVPDWGRSDRAARVFMDTRKAQKTVEPNDVVYRRLISGEAPNEDQWLS